ncbi:MAG TPA: 7-carboxy-7-deazaguanine synthase [bacterium]|nr:7-carboxy-7-deazaguanine synthase [bacterium]
MAYQVHELFYSLQGEGFHAGRPAVFCRFAGCNLWSGRDEERELAACVWCDTDFVGTTGDGGGEFAAAAALADAIVRRWSGDAAGGALVVCTGGEPLLQLDPPLLAALHARGCTVAVETNGTLVPPAGIDWLCVSPKAGTELAARAGDELKLVYPQAGLDPQQYAGLAFRHFFLQPCDDARRQENTAAAVAYCLAHPQWRLSVQLHKLLQIR